MDASLGNSRARILAFLASDACSSQPARMAFEVACENNLRRELVEEALKLAFLDPATTFSTINTCRSSILPLVAYIVDEATHKKVSQSQEEVLACSLALLKALALCSHVEREVTRYFEHFPSPGRQFEQVDFTMAGVCKRECAMSMLFGLMSYPDLCKLWDWNDGVSLLFSDDGCVRWCGVKFLGLILGYGEGFTLQMVQRYVGNLEMEAIVEWMNFRATIHLYARDNASNSQTDVSAPRPVLQQSPQLVMQTGDKRQRRGASDEFFWPFHLPERYANIEGLLVMKGESAFYPSSSLASEFLATEDQSCAARNFAVFLSLRFPVLIEGPPSCGKTALIDHMARLTSNVNDMIIVHVDDQLDVKMLTGTYICTSRPGEFTWSPGPLTRALLGGHWLVIENVHLSSPEVITVIMSVARNKKVLISSRGEEIRAASGFQLIMTSTHMPGMTDFVMKNSLASHCSRIVLPELSMQDQVMIISHTFPMVSRLLGPLFRSVELMRGVSSLSEPVSNEIFEAVERLKALGAYGCTGRLSTFRDVIKWSRRMKSNHSRVLNSMADVSFDDVSMNVSLLPFAVREGAFQEFCDCFCMSISSKSIKNLVMIAVSEVWALPKSSVESCIHLGKPEISTCDDHFKIGRARLPLNPKKKKDTLSTTFARTGEAMRLMERLALAISENEPVLLVGETGTGKTTVIQELARMTGKDLSVVNLSQQTDTSDLIGGYRPIQAGDSIRELMPVFTDLVKETWTKGDNEEYLSRIVKLARKNKWKHLLKAFRAAQRKYSATCHDGQELSSTQRYTGAKRSRNASESSNIDSKWIKFSEMLEQAEAIAAIAENGFAFGFQEGVLVQALRQGRWLLLDEINLAPAEVLERVSGILESGQQGILMTEKGDTTKVMPHPDFRLFGAMNPSTDAGKKDLPQLVRNRFTEFWVNEPEEEKDLAAIVSQHLSSVSYPVRDIVEFYLKCKDLASNIFQDGTGKSPVYNLRTLSRALQYTKTFAREYGLKRALIDGFAMSFQTQLDSKSSNTLSQMLSSYFLKNDVTIKGILSSVPAAPSLEHVLFEQYWVECGPFSAERKEEGAFVKTKTVRTHLRNIARAVLLRKYPILLQGPTSSGKTSLVSYLASETGHKCIRINNHEHTDIQEYLGTYITDSEGKLRFHEGPLVQALRKGYWIILDELNLAPSEVLEALNRLLDDNRELFVPELQEVVQPHPHFMLFATQNPPGIYAGRKTLSRAFRSRFLELHVDDIPDEELGEILERRCKIPPSYSKRMVDVMRQLQRRRSSTNALAGRHGFITPRDLFRWANRQAVGYDELALNGIFVLGERLREKQEKQILEEIMATTLRVKIDPDKTYDAFDFSSESVDMPEANIGKIVWTRSFKRVYYLLKKCLEHDEPALLVGETGIGKTTACQLLAYSRSQNITIINCNQHTETSDFLGGYRPNRSRVRLLEDIRQLCREFNGKFDSEILRIEMEGETSFASIEALAKQCEAKSSVEDDLVHIRDSILQKIGMFLAPFEWVDGPLVAAMRNGEILLIDELNLAEDAVLERLNSVLESEKTLTLAEKSGPDTEVIMAKKGFQIIATMNPGGDFGKKELSPALSNRFTTIWVPGLEDDQELLSILQSRMSNESKHLAELILRFWVFYRREIELLARQSLSIRDMLCWIEFINTCSFLSPLDALVHGSRMAIIDGLGTGSGASQDVLERLRYRCIDYLSSITVAMDDGFDPEVRIGMVDLRDSTWGINPFFITVQHHSSSLAGYDFTSNTTRENLFKVLRALQLNRPLLLEGSPGVGKTSLIESMAEATGRNFIRVNLSDQTDMMDLVGSNLPSSSVGAGEFAWSDGPLIIAMKQGAWLLLDELNLASQSVLEGLNALLDHRGEMFIPELNSTIRCKPGFRLFGAQNPVQEGGGRKGLPRSFLNRFIRVNVHAFARADMVQIASAIYKNVPTSLIENMVDCIIRCSYSLRIRGGQEWDFNLRDLMRWLRLVSESLSLAMEIAESDVIFWAVHYSSLILKARLRSREERVIVHNIVKECLGTQEERLFTSALVVDPLELRIGRAPWSRMNITSPQSESPSGDYLLRSFFPVQEALIECVRRNWLGILVGAQGSGKASCIKNLSCILGAQLVDIQLHQGTDISDLLGGFEQLDIHRRGSVVKEEVTLLFRYLTFWMIEQNSDISFLSDLWRKLDLGSAQPMTNSLVGLFLQARRSFEAIADLLPVEYKIIAFKIMETAFKEAENFVAMGTNSAGKFEWVDGTLTRAISRGNWVILRDANLCNPSILDRLNPLFEPGGQFSLNECGSGDSGPRVVSPHENFRLFITYDPRNGEISRAMRNRGIEIYLSADEVTGMPQTGIVESNESFSSSDLVGLATKIVFNSESLTTSLIRGVLSTQKLSLSLHRDFSTMQAMSYCQKMIHGLVAQGVPLGEATAFAMAQTLEEENLGTVCSQVTRSCSDFSCPSILDICALSGTAKLYSDWSFFWEYFGLLFRKCVVSSHSDWSLGTLLKSFDAMMLCSGQQLKGSSTDDCIVSPASTVSHRKLLSTTVAYLTIYLEQSLMKSTSSYTHLLESVMSKLRGLCFSQMESNLEYLLNWSTSLIARACTETQMLSSMSGDRLGMVIRAGSILHTLEFIVENLPKDYEGCRTILERSAWVYRNPFMRKKDKESRQILDWLWPAMSHVARAFSQAVLIEDKSVAVALEWLWIMLNWTHLTSETDISNSTEKLAYSWSQIKSVLKRSPLLVEEEYMEKLSSALGLDCVPLSSKSLQFTSGAPLVPSNNTYYSIQNRVLDICESVSIRPVSGEGTSTDVAEGIIPDWENLFATRRSVLEGAAIVLTAIFQDQEASTIDQILKRLAQCAHAVNRKPWLIASRMLQGCIAVEAISMLNLESRLIHSCIIPIITQNSLLDISNFEESLEQLETVILSSPGLTVADAIPIHLLSLFSNALDESTTNESSEKIKMQKGLSNLILIQWNHHIWERLPFLGKEVLDSATLINGSPVARTVLSMTSDASETSLGRKHNKIVQLSRTSKALFHFQFVPNAGEMDWKSTVLYFSSFLESLLETTDAESLRESLNSYLSQKSTGMDKNMQSIIDKILKVGDLKLCHHMTHSHQSWLSEICELLFQDLDIQKNSLIGSYKRGKAICLTHGLRLSLLQPAKGFDPAMVNDFKKESFKSILEDFYVTEKTVREEYAALPLASDQSTSINALCMTCANISNSISVLKRGMSARPAVSRYLELCKNIQEFMDHVCSAAKLQEIVGLMDTSVSNNTGELNLKVPIDATSVFIDNIGSFLRKLSVEYSHYKDIYGPLEISMQGIRHGLQLMAQCTGWIAEHRYLGSIDRILCFHTFMESYLQQLLDLHSNMLTSPSTAEVKAVVQSCSRSTVAENRKDEEMTIQIELYIASLKSASVLWRFSKTSGRKKKVSKYVEELSSSIHKLWHTIKEQERKQKEEEESTFVLKQRKLDILKDEDLVEMDYVSLFPEQYSRFSDLLATEDQDDTMKFQAPETQATSSAILRKDMITGELLQEACRVHSALYNEKVGVDILEAHASRFVVGSKLLGLLQKNVPLRLDAECISGYHMNVLSRWKAISPSSPGDCTGLDMYKMHVDEASLACEPVKTLLIRVEKLLSDWPDHPILLQVKKIAERLLNISLESPLKAFSTGLELILNTSQLWEETAARHVKLEFELKPLISIASRWRRLELESWKHILQRVKTEFADEAKQSWFHLYGIFESISEETNLEDIIAALDDFIQGSPVGQFMSRLHVLKVFSGRFATIQQEREIETIITNFTTYYHQFTIDISDYISQEIKPLEKDLADFVALATWEDRGYYAMKASSEQAQRHLHKLVRKAKTILNTPSSIVLKKSSERLGSLSFGSCTESTDVISTLCDTQRLQGLLDRHASNEMRPWSFDKGVIAGKHSSNISRLSRTFNSVIASASSTLGTWVAVPDSIAALTVNAVSQIHFIRQDSSRGAKARKKKALSDFLKELEGLGVSPLQSAIPLGHRKPHSWLRQAYPNEQELLSMISFTYNSEGDLDLESEVLTRSRSLFYESIALYYRLKEVAKEPHQDLQHREVDLAFKLSRNMIYLNQKLKGMLQKTTSLTKDIQKAAELIQGLGKHGHMQSTMRDLTLFENLEDMISFCLQYSTEYVDYLVTLNTAGVESDLRESATRSWKALESARETLMKCSEDLFHARASSIELHSGHPFMTAEMVSALERSRNVLKDNISKTLRNMEAFPGSDKVKTHFSNLLSLTKCTNAKDQPSKNKNAFGDTLENLVRSCLLWAQDIHQLPKISEDDVSLSDAMENIENKICCKTLDSLKDNLFQTLEALALTHFEEKQVTHVNAFMKRFSPVLETVLAALETYIRWMLDLDRALSKLTHITIKIFCNLLENGFCTPEEIGEGEAREDTKEGTGLGEGDTTGAKDISKELENEDQILGAQQENAEEKRDQDLGNATGNDGIEMEEDFEGNMADIEQDRDMEDGDDEEDEEEEGRLEQQMGDAGEEADDVDERFWDDKDSQENKEAKAENDKPMHVEDASKMDYAQGNESDDGEAEHSDRNIEEDNANDQDLQQEDAEEDAEEGEEDYQETMDTGFLQPEAPADQMEFPDDINLDGEEVQENTENETEDMVSVSDEEDVKEIGTNQDADQDDEIAADDMKQDDEIAADDMKQDDEIAADDIKQDESESGEKGGNISHEVDIEVQGEDENNTSETDQGLPSVTQGDPGNTKDSKHASGEDEQQKDHKGEEEERPEIGQARNNPEAIADAEGGQGQALGLEKDSKAEGQAATGRTAGEKTEKETTKKETNPFRNLGEAAKAWQESLKIEEDAQEDIEMTDVDKDPMKITENQDIGYRFMSKEEESREDNQQLMADATEDQAQQAMGIDDVKEEGVQGEDDGMAVDKGDEDESDLQQQEVAEVQSSMQQKSSIRQEKLISKVERESDVIEEEKSNTAKGEPGSVAQSSMSKLHELTDMLMPVKEEDETEDELRAELNERILNASKKKRDEDENDEYGREIWTRCEKLTRTLSMELAEQLRLILEPTLTSKLGGEYRSGKRINMRRVITYIASHFRKDKIWMRRSQPDKRKYQVLVAIDDSRSMAENSCGTFALESLTLICNAITKLEVGDFGIVRFGGEIGAEQLHPLGQPFRAQDGASVMSKLKFDQDNTINDKPMVDVLTSIDQILEKESRALSMGLSGRSSLQQLVILLADGRFHERDALQRAARHAVSRPGCLYAFIVLDRSENSIIDMKSVSFVDGKPVFARYLDSFPFPLYIVLQDIQHLPKTLADLLRQWMEFSSQLCSYK